MVVSFFLSIFFHNKRNDLRFKFIVEMQAALFVIHNNETRSVLRRTSSLQYKIVYLKRLRKSKTIS